MDMKDLRLIFLYDFKLGRKTTKTTEEHQTRDRILEWGGVTLVDRTFEEVSDIIERTGDNVEVVIEQDNGKANENQSRSPHSSHHTVTWSSISPRSPTLSLLPDPSNIPDVQPISPTRRKLPRTPTQTPKPLSLGEIAIRLWFDHSRTDLQVTLLSAKGLRRRKTPGNLASTFAKLRLVPQSGFGTKVTQLAESSTSPKWNQTFVFPSVSSEELLDKSLEITVWDESPAENKTLIGGTEIQFQKTDIQDCPEWYPLTSCQPPPLSPSLIQKIQHSSVSGHDLIARKAVNQAGQESLHTFSDDKEDQYKDEEKDGIPKSSSMDFTFLPSEDAWDQIQQRPTDGGSGYCVEAANATRLLANKKTSVQLTTRDDSPDFHVKPKIKDQERNTSVHSNKSCTSDSEKAENLAGPTHKSTTRETKLLGALSQGSDIDDKSVALDCKLASTSISSPDLTPENEIPIMTIGPTGIKRGAGQVFPPNTKLDGVETLGEIKLGFLLTKGQLEVEVFCACQLPLSSLGQPPDTYIKTYLKEGEKQMQKRKTRIVRSTSSPQYRQTLKYSMSDIQGRHLLVMVWERQKGFDHNHPMGTVEIELGRLDLSKSMICWYPLYPLPSHEPDSCVSP
ncbi:regulating synaptic membrane exocytosis protein 2-like [Tachypleus tridentatus]|uniref:regulating synaptic membrane exocytosis protein 2-like n=1 Tax=Tachypleus tridentatus TaxID=6853 RepID=UPI003FD24345